MLTVSEALEKILKETKSFAPIEIPLGKSLGLTLAEKVISDRDNPPFNKALMDGYAIQAEDVLEGHANLEIIEEVTAGSVPSKKVLKGQATRIMTGAPLPEGADLVVPFEEAELFKLVEQDTAGQGSGAQRLTEMVSLNASKKNAGSNMMPQGTVLKKGDTVLEQGAILDFQKLGALAEIGKSKIQVHRCPTVSVLATGDELVEVTAVPKEGQIRNSNETMLAAQIENAGAVPNRLGIAKDIQDEIESKIIQGLQFDILLLSGGVSAGILDLVPSALKKCGVKEIFHKVKLKPGKPVWFGVYQKEEDNGIVKKCYVFGLPGNPVGSMVCFELFVRAAIRSLKGMNPLAHPPIQARLESDYSMKGDRELYYPCYLKNVSGVNQITLLNWQGSADLQSTVNANAMAVFPSGNHEYSAGGFVDVMLWS